MLGLSALPIKYWIPAGEVVLLEKALSLRHNWIIWFNVLRKPELRKRGNFNDTAPSTCILKMHVDGARFFEGDNDIYGEQTI